MEDYFISVIGPVSSDWGRKYWNLFFREDAIVACPYTFRESLQLGFHFQLKVWPADPGAPLRGRADEGMTEFDLPRDRKLRRYPANLLKRIVVHSNYTANTISFVKLSGDEDVYSIPLREETDIYREELSDFYPAIYIEKGFPATAIGRILKK